jgi:hypothetical protein
MQMPTREGDQTAFFASATYRFTRWLQLGTYHSRFQDIGAGIEGVAAFNAHIYDQTVTARFDIRRYWTLKVEQHFMDGVGNPVSAHGFYLSDNPQGLKPDTKLFVVRFGFSI